MSKSKPHVPVEYLTAIARLKEKRGTRKLARGDCKFWVLASPAKAGSLRELTIAAGATAHEAWMSSRVEYSFAEIECQPLEESGYVDAAVANRFVEQAVSQCIP